MGSQRVAARTILERESPLIRSRKSSLLVLTLTPLLAAGCSKQDDGKVRFERANVIVITLDTVRYDRLGSSGYARPTTPNLDALAKESVRFERAYAQSSFTPPSHASLLTARFPSSHGLTWWDNKLPDKVTTLAETLRDSNYKTAMVSGLGMGRGNGLDQGFDRVVENKDFGFKLPIAGIADYVIPPGDRINEIATRWIDAAEGKPFFTWFHYYDAHRPFGIFVKDRAFGDRAARFGDDTSRDYQLDPQERAARGIGAEHAQILSDRYDSGLLDLDAKVGKLIDHLRATGKLDSTILVVTADHGEAFTEYDEEWFTHDPFLFDAVTHVPLIIRFPGGKFGGKVVPHLAQLVDVMPTLLDYLGFSKRDLLMQGLSLRPAIERDEPVNEWVAAERRGRSREKAKEGGEEAFVDLPPETVGARRSVRFEDDKRLVIEQHGEQVRLYVEDVDGVAKPAEMDPESAEGKGRLGAYRKLRKLLESLQPDAALSEMSPEQLEFLRQNGYLPG
jgi:arylsulfatase A-like enzyme